MAGARASHVVGGQALQPFGAKCVEVPGQHLLHLLLLGQRQEPLAAAHVVVHMAVRQPVNHGAVVHYVAAEQQLVIDVVEANAAARVAWHVQHRQLTVTQVDDIA